MINKNILQIRKRLDSLDNAFNCGTLSLDQRCAVLTLLPKPEKELHMV